MLLYTAVFSSLSCFILFILTFILTHRHLSSFHVHHFKIGKQLLPRFSYNHSSPWYSFIFSEPLFRKYCKYISNLKNLLWILYARMERTMLFPPVSVCMSVLPLAFSWLLCNSWTTWRVSNKIGTRVYHFETMSTAYGSGGCLQGPCH